MNLKENHVELSTNISNIVKIEIEKDFHLTKSL